MKNKLFIPFLGLFSIVLFTCKSDDTPSETIDPELTLDQVVAKVTDNGNLKTWKIESATLTNNSVNDLEVTNAFNIKDDEFRFSLENSVLQLEHRQRHDFNKNASDYQSFLLEAYKSALNYTLINSVDVPTKINSTDNALKFNYQNDNLITGEWTLDANTTLSFNLIVKTAADYQTVSTSLNFEEVATIPAEYFFYESLGSTDIIGSQSNNSLYLAYTTNWFNNPTGESNRAEGIIRYDISTSQFDHNIFHNSDFFTKRAYINNNQLKIVGSKYINTYNNLNTLNNPDTSFLYNLPTVGSGYTYFRYDIVMYNDLIYIMGGNPDVDSTMPDYFDKVLTYNEATDTFNELTSLPTPKSQAAIEFVDGKIYIFSGVQAFGNHESAEALSYIYDINNNSFTSFNLPQALSVSFTTTKEHLIYVGGQVPVLDNDNNTVDINAYLGVYNTNNNTFTEITHNLDDSDTSSRIHGITYFNDELYVVYGNNWAANEGVTKIYKANL